MQNVFVRMAPSLAEKISNAKIFMVPVFFQRGAKSWDHEDLEFLDFTILYRYISRNLLQKS